LTNKDFIDIGSIKGGNVRALKITNMLFLTFVSLTVLFQGSARAGDSNRSFSLRLYGGWNYVLGGDFNDGLKGINDYYAKYFWYFGLTKSGGGYNPVHQGMNFGGDFVIQITPAVGIGLGAGYLQGKRESSITFTPVAAAETTTAEVSAVPLRLGLYLTFPAKAIVRFNIHAGLGYYLAKVSFNFRSSAPGSWGQKSVKADANGLGYHGGIGLELKFTSAVSFFLEGQARYARIGGFKGTGENSDSSGHYSSDSGKLYYYQTYSTALGAFPAIFVHSAAPSGSSVGNVKEAEIDFGGYSAVAGLIFRF